MNKVFLHENDAEIEEEEYLRQVSQMSQVSLNKRNYITVAGAAAIRSEFERLVKIERPELVQVVSWAAGNGDRSENGDYIYGKKRLREIDRRIRYLNQRLETAVVVDAAEQENTDQIFFGACVTVSEIEGDVVNKNLHYQIVGVDEADAAAGKISWISPLAQALMKKRIGDVVRLSTPSGVRQIEVIQIFYN